jgi:hypothetical protein
VDHMSVNGRRGSDKQDGNQYFLSVEREIHGLFKFARQFFSSLVPWLDRSKTFLEQMNQ